MLQISTKASGQKTSLQRIVHPPLPDMACQHSIRDPSCLLSLSTDCRPFCTESGQSAVNSSQTAAELPAPDGRVGVPAFDLYQHGFSLREVCSSDSYAIPGIQQVHSQVFVTDQRIAADSRAALLRKRFADTIYNAHEKQRLLLNQNDSAERVIGSKQLPLPYVQRRRWEKKGKSQVKRPLRNEKAKELAEARLRAKAELEKCMQQTVEIDENSGISNILKRFESCFARYGRIPLERLGLFLKADTDE